MSSNAPLRAVTIAQSDLRKKIAELDATAEKLMRKNSETNAEIESIQAAEADDAVAALLDGAAISPGISERRRSKIALLNKSADSTSAALEQLPGRRAKLQAAFEALVPELTDAALDEIFSRRLAALQKVRAGLVVIAEPLAELSASDMLEHDLLGQSFAFDPAKHSDLFSGRVVVSRFLDSLPVRLTPDELDAFALRNRATEIANRWLDDITGESK